MHMTTVFGQPNAQLAELAQAYLAKPNDDTAIAILNVAGLLDNGYVEEGCVEHGVIHINVYEAETDSDVWYEIDPATGCIEAC